jgi:hypothetical protein
MFKPATLKIITYICFVGSIAGLVYTSYYAYPFKNWEDYSIPLSWFFLALSAYWALRIIQRYTYATNLQTVGWYIYLIFLLMILFVAIKLSVGVIPVLFLAFGLNNRNVAINEKIKKEKDI